MRVSRRTLIKITSGLKRSELAAGWPTTLLCPRSGRAAGAELAALVGQRGEALEAISRNFEALSALCQSEREAKVPRSVGG